MAKEYDYQYELDGKNYPFSGRRAMALEAYMENPEAEPEEVAERMQDEYGDPAKGTHLGTARRVKGIFQKLSEAGVLEGAEEEEETEEEEEAEEAEEIEDEDEIEEED